ncbi:xylan 1,4-beta-xylosidase [Streptomyces sp. HC44]|uniref:Xylan 1,4-beta-xylosidase n=1 Tax=Streptomyces scabichelini TaxID=2711217 RepID=A0A6G4V4W5_9ACTN|nr:xylan 1,4-beta-xylosidase [Streptomyces scabichelini]NGO09056.1 xylan 1,4-beta-xylosidase [Streptomyces scabichelini]
MSDIDGAESTDREGRSAISTRGAVAHLGIVATVLALVLACTPAPVAGPSDSSLGWGLTHTQYSADVGDSAAVKTARKALSAQSLPQNQHVMGWGAGNPEPSPGRYDFSALDRRMDLIRQTGGTPVITLCCAPDWMKGGTPGRTAWSRLETAPSPDHYDDFAALAATVAERYPDVRHFIVWNEFKGFFDESKNRWNHEGYTALYNRVHRALKKVNEENLVGGPYLTMDSYPPRHTMNASDLRGPWGSIDQRVLNAFDYWNRHKAGADFVVVDGTSYTRNGTAPPDEFRATDKFTAVGRWVRQRTSAPLWWAEYHIERGDNGDRDHGSESLHRALQAAGLIAMVKGGATTGFYWNPQNRGEPCARCLWRSTELTDGTGGHALPVLDLIRRFDKEFPPGTTYRSVDVAPDDAPKVRVLANDKVMLVVNTLDRPLKAKIDGRTVNLDGYQVRWFRAVARLGQHL